MGLPEGHDVGTSEGRAVDGAGEGRGEGRPDGEGVGGRLGTGVDGSGLGPGVDGSGLGTGLGSVDGVGVGRGLGSGDGAGDGAGVEGLGDGPAVGNVETVGCIDGAPYSSPAAVWKTSSIGAPPWNWRLPSASSNTHEISESVALIRRWWTPSSRHMYWTPSYPAVRVAFVDVPFVVTTAVAPDQPSPTESYMMSL